MKNIITLSHDCLYGAGEPATWADNGKPCSGFCVEEFWYKDNSEYAGCLLVQAYSLKEALTIVGRGSPTVTYW